MAEDTVRWNVFRTALLRSAGFPSEWLGSLAGDVPDPLAERYAEARDRRERARNEALDTLWDMRATVDGPDRTVLNRAINTVRGRRNVVDSSERVLACVSAWNAVNTDFTTVHASVVAELSTALAAEYDREVDLLLAHTSSAEFRDAVLLSSPSAYESFVRNDNTARFRGSKLELTAYRFLQRFSAKCETGGSIGPLNLMSVGEDPGRPVAAGAASVRSVEDATVGRVHYTAVGDGRAARRRSLLSYWAACELGQSLLRGPGGAPRERQPYRVFATPVTGASPAELDVLRHVDGQTPVSTLAVITGLAVDEVDRLVDGLVRRGVLDDTWYAPYFTSDPGWDVQKLAEVIGTAEAVRASELVSDVREFAHTPFEDRPMLLGSIARRFTQLTDRPAWRGAGGLRTDRAVVYEEAIDNVPTSWIDTAGGRRLTDRLSTALDLVASFAIEDRATGQSMLAAELDRRGVRELPAADVRALPGVQRPAGGPATRRERFQRLVDTDLPCVELSRADLTDAGIVADDIADWPVFGAADVMLSGPAAGEPLVLSELHHIWPTLACWVRALYDDDALGNGELWRIVADELAPAVPTLQEIVRNEKATDSSAHGHAVLCLDKGLPTPGGTPVPIDRVVVRRWNDGFVGLHDPHDGRDLWLMPEYPDSGVELGGLIHCCIPALHLPSFAVGGHTPRIVVDGVVVQRRRWQVAVADVPTITGRVPGAQDWLVVQVWRHGLGLPGRVYFMPDTERKPIFLDFSSVVSVANFAACVRAAERVVLTEALPDPEHLWLRTGDGTVPSEIRTLLWRDRGRAGPA